MFKPNFQITPEITKFLMAIEADRQAVEGLPVDIEMIASLRESARLNATHYSTQIEGNRLTLPQVDEVVKGSSFPGRERDAGEVRNYYKALEWVEKLSAELHPVTEKNIQTIHGLVSDGHARETPYREEQNVIKNSISGDIVYMPPTAKDVPSLMADLIAWLDDELTSNKLPIPLVAGLAHYQYATIHPYYDGNGRTARLLTTLILHHAGYGLKGIYSLEEYYAQNLPRYYETLTVGPSHNYYLGRAEADITPFLTFFCEGMASAFAAVRAQAAKASARGASDMSVELSKLDRRQRLLLALFKAQGTATAVEMALCIGVTHGSMLPLCRKWVKSGFLELADPSRKNRCYRLGKANLK